jgi:hypothetical protein
VKIGGYLTPSLFVVSCYQFKLGARSSTSIFPSPSGYPSFQSARNCSFLGLKPKEILKNDRIRRTEIRKIIKLTIKSLRIYCNPQATCRNLARSNLSKID